MGEQGQRWHKIGTALGRLPKGCRDKWRLVVAEKKGAPPARPFCVSTLTSPPGAWSYEEELKLVELVAKYFPGPAPPLKGILWTPISNAMGRAHNNCRDHWYGTPSPITLCLDWPLQAYMRVPSSPRPKDVLVLGGGHRVGQQVHITTSCLDVMVSMQVVVQHPRSGCQRHGGCGLGCL